MEKIKFCVLYEESCIPKLYTKKGREYENNGVGEYLNF